MKGGILIRNIYQRFTDNSTRKPSSFTRNAPAEANSNQNQKPPTQEEDNGEFDANDIDEQSSPGTIPKPAFKQLRTPFVPHAMEEMKTPSKKPAPQSSYLKSIATPMQSRRVMRPKPDAKKVNSYFQKLGEAATKSNAGTQESAGEGSKSSGRVGMVCALLKEQK